MLSLIYKRVIRAGKIRSARLYVRVRVRAGMTLTGRGKRSKKRKK